MGMSVVKPVGPVYFPAHFAGLNLSVQVGTRLQSCFVRRTCSVLSPGQTVHDSR